VATSDGISDAEWDVIQQFAEQIADANSLGASDQFLASGLKRELKKLASKYGRLPSIVATEADYTRDKVKELSLLKEAYVGSCELSDFKNKSYIAASIAEYYVERVLDIGKANYWLSQLQESLKGYSDDYLVSVYEDVKGTIEDSNS
jgi:hypothetical protein